MSLSDKNCQKRVLVLDAEQFSTLSIVRSLGRKKIHVTVGSLEGVNSGIATYSKYTNEVIYYSDPLIDENKFIKEIVGLVSQGNFDLLIPVTENTLLPLAKNRQLIEKYTCLALPENKTLELVIDKSKTIKIAIEEEVPVPKSIVVHNKNQLKKLIGSIQYPVVLKPCRSIVELGLDVKVKLSVQYASNKEELISKCENLLQYAPIILQEYFYGDGVGVEVLAEDGEISMIFQHKRLHELPLTGGASTLRESVPLDPQLLNYSKKMIKRLRWHGVAMLEFKYNDKTKQYSLMEINGRLWGSLPLAVAAGADFPYALFSLLVLKTLPPSTPIKMNCINRKLNDDLYWLIVVLLRRDANPLIQWPNYRTVIKDYLSIFCLKHSFDSFAFDDIKPYFIDVYHTSVWFYERLKKMLEDKWLTHKFLRIKKSNRVKQSIKTVNNILFLCYGNINRSALAQKIYQYLVRESDDLHVFSAGFHAQAGRPADPIMVQVASERGIDLSDWSSQSLTAEAIAKADLILVMEIAHYQKLLSLFPSCKNKIYLLGCMTTNSQDCPLEIVDPYGLQKEAYIQCFNHIQKAIMAIINARSE